MATVPVELMKLLKFYRLVPLQILSPGPFLFLVFLLTLLTSVQICAAWCRHLSVRSWSEATKQPTTGNDFSVTLYLGRCQVSDLEAEGFVIHCWWSVNNAFSFGACNPSSIWWTWHRRWCETAQRQLLMGITVQSDVTRQFSGRQILELKENCLVPPNMFQVMFQLVQANRGYSSSNI